MKSSRSPRRRRPRYRNDMLHIALATLARVDVLVSWNFRHIVRLDKIQAFNGVNRERGLDGVERGHLESRTAPGPTPESATVRIKRS